VGRSRVCSLLVCAIDLLTYFFGLVRHQVMLAAIRAIAQLNKKENANRLNAQNSARNASRIMGNWQSRMDLARFVPNTSILYFIGKCD
jgi:cellobiose-specific phosphotransferase system component IIC